MRLEMRVIYKARLSSPASANRQVRAREGDPGRASRAIPEFLFQYATSKAGKLDRLGPLPSRRFAPLAGDDSFAFAWHRAP
jgi:hypothetical protein